MNHTVRVLNFGDEDHISVVRESTERQTIKKIKRKSNHISTNRILIFMIKSSRKNVRARGFKGASVIYLSVTGWDKG